MIQYSRHIFQKLSYELLICMVLMFFLASAAPSDEVANASLIAALLFLGCFCIDLIRYWVVDHGNAMLLARDRVDVLTDSIDDYLRAHKAVDIWQYQYDLMKASDQRVETLPIIHKGVLLYARLIAEEYAEMLRGLGSDLDAYVKQQGGQADEQGQALSFISEDIADVAVTLEHLANSLKGKLSYVQDDWELQFSEAGLRETFDGVNDVAVVLAGFGLAAGLPVREGYVETGSSNLSKANPVTGKIDKDSSGKWIKGRDYRAPDLARVLAVQRVEVYEDAHPLGL